MKHGAFCDYWSGCLSLVMAGMTLACTPTRASDFVLADPAAMAAVAVRMDFVGANAFSVESTPKGSCLRSTPDRSASALDQALDVEGRELLRLQWWWRVDQLHRTADIRSLAKEDFGAKVLFVFGEPSLLHRDVPSLAYVWTSTPIANGTILPSRRFDSLAYIQLRGRADVGYWHLETRDVVTDFQAAFGRSPGPLKHIAVFNDNDQTGEPTTALFCQIISRGAEPR